MQIYVNMVSKMKILFGIVRIMYKKNELKMYQLRKVSLVDFA